MGYLLTQMFLYMLGAFLLGLALGWLLWGHLRGRISELEAENARLRAELGRQKGDLDRLKGDLDACGKARGDAERRIRELEAELAALRARPAPVAPAPAPVVQAPAALLSVPAKKPAAPAPKPAKPKAAPVAKVTAPAKPDNLRRMIGIGPVNERLLHKAGVTTFAQIAKWNAAEVKRIEEILQFDGRIERERWIEQAKLLAAGNDKEFLKRFPTAGTDKNS